MGVASEIVHFEITVDEHGVWRADLRARSREHLAFLCEAAAQLLEPENGDAKLGPDVEISKPQ